MIVAEALLHALKARGARELFGIPGDFALPFFKVVEESGILPFYCLSHEPAVGFAADAAARFNCAIGVAAVTYGAGAFNMVNAVAAAYAERVPVAVISGAPGLSERGHGLLVHHQAKTIDSQYLVYREITCDQARLDDPATAPQAIARVLKSCRERSLPVYIELPRDRVSATCGPVPADAPSAVDADALAACAEEVLAHLAQAKAPVMMVDVEIRRYGIEDKVAELARRLGLPVVTSFMGRGLLAEASPPPLGTYMGIAGDDDITRMVEDSDGLLLLGVILSDTNFGVSRRTIDLRRTIQAFDGQVSLGYHVYPNIPITAFVEALLARIGRPAGKPPAPRPRAYPTKLVADERPLHPDDIACGVNDMMERHGLMPIAADMGDCLFTALDMKQTRLVAPGYYAGMGYGVPAGLGVQATTGERVLILVGDGAFQMTGWELGNCRRYGWDPIVIVFNNQSWEMLRSFQPESRFNDLDDWHFAEAANAIGGEGVRVATRRELAAAIEHAATTRGRFQLIEAMIPRGALSGTLARFVEGIRKRREQSAVA
ncbi:MAG TPA: indolepyruvate/phenylpyruvate decarboxylase [Alphaproteobacteria bacterium]|nr:indolepyruvate/phenylpyruvate decarboxylase [Alphaproteobacteria bacterium]